VSCLLATAGLVALSKATGMAILAAATLYGIGKSYLWPTVLGIVAERFPKGGALSLNAASAVGMMSVGVMGTVFLGLIQDRAIETRLLHDNPALHEQVVSSKKSVLGSYQAVDPARVQSLAPSDQNALHEMTAAASKGALATTAIFPAAMLVAYLGLFLVFRARGGYRAIALGSTAVDPAAQGTNTRHSGQSPPNNHAP
jgi:hypothetical protein